MIAAMSASVFASVLALLVLVCLVLAILMSAALMLLKLIDFGADIAYRVYQSVLAAQTSKVASIQNIELTQAKQTLYIDWARLQLQRRRAELLDSGLLDDQGLALSVANLTTERQHENTIFLETICKQEVIA